MNTSKICTVCGGKIGFASSEFRRHEATKRHLDFAARTEVLPVEEVVADLIAGERTFDGTVLSILSGSLSLAPVESDEARRARHAALPQAPAEVETPEGQETLEAAAKAAQKARRLAEKESSKMPKAVATVTPEVAPVPVSSSPEVSDRKAQIAGLKASRMRQLWTFQRAQRRADKAAEAGSPEAPKLAKVAAAELKKERAAYAEYHKVLTDK